MSSSSSKAQDPYHILIDIKAIFLAVIGTHMNILIIMKVKIPFLRNSSMHEELGQN